MLSNKLKIRELVGSYRVLPLFFCVEKDLTRLNWLNWAFDDPNELKYIEIGGEWDEQESKIWYVKWYDHLCRMKCYLYDFRYDENNPDEIFSQQYWLYENDEDEEYFYPFTVNKRAVAKDRFISSNEGVGGYNFWKDAIYDPKGIGELKPNAQ